MGRGFLFDISRVVYLCAIGCLCDSEINGDCWRQETGTEMAAGTAAETEPVITATSYADENIQISIETLQEYDSTLYVADVQVSDVAYLKTAFANSTYGRNVKAKTSEIAACPECDLCD